MMTIVAVLLASGRAIWTVLWVLKACEWYVYIECNYVHQDIMTVYFEEI